MDENILAQARLRRALVRLSRLLRFDHDREAASMVEEFLGRTWDRTSVREFEHQVEQLWVRLMLDPVSGMPVYGPRTRAAVAVNELLYSLNDGFGETWRVITLAEASRIAKDLAALVGESEFEEKSLADELNASRE